MAWRVGDAADPLSYCALARGRQIAFSAAQAGDFVLHFTAENAEGEASLDVPVTVRDCDGPLLCPGEQVAVALPGGVAQGTCACEVQEGEPVEGVHLAELVVAPDHLRDRLPGLALVPVAPPAAPPARPWARTPACGWPARASSISPPPATAPSTPPSPSSPSTAGARLRRRRRRRRGRAPRGGSGRRRVPGARRRPRRGGPFTLDATQGEAVPPIQPEASSPPTPPRASAHRPLRRLRRPRAPVRPGHRRARSPHPGRPPARGRRRRRCGSRTRPGRPSPAPTTSRAWSPSWIWIWRRAATASWSRPRMTRRSPSASRPAPASRRLPWPSAPSTT
ncbi:MAG: hypothetical protein R3F43_24780 [bacterium]